MARHSNPHCLLVFLSPDKVLKLLVMKQDGGLSLGFEGYQWHVHGDMLLAEYEAETEDAAVGYFIHDLFTGARAVIIHKRGGGVVDISVGYRSDSPFYSDPRNDPYSKPDESVEVRRWDS